MSLSMDGQEIEQVQSFIYLGSYIIDDGCLQGGNQKKHWHS